MKPRKLPSGKWNCLVYYKDGEGKPHRKSITADTKQEVLFQAAIWKKEEEPKRQTLTVKQAIENYIMLSDVLSPTTIQGYEKTLKYAFKSITELDAFEITDEQIQKAISLEMRRPSLRTGKPLSAKTIKNEYGVLIAALHLATNKTYNVKLPRYQKHIKYYPNPEQVLNAIIGSEIELPCLLAMWMSFTMSEIRGLMFSDIQDGYITINRVMVDVGNIPTVKANAKTETRLRKHRLPEYIKSLIKENGSEYIVPQKSNWIYKRWKKICKDNDWELSFHDLRHYAASIPLMLGISDKYIMERGGWSSPGIMKSVYQNTFDSARTDADNKIDLWFTQNIKAE